MEPLARWSEEKVNKTALLLSIGLVSAGALFMLGLCIYVIIKLMVFL